MDINKLLLDFQITIETANYAHINTHYGWVNRLSFTVCGFNEPKDMLVSSLERIEFVPSYNLVNYEIQARAATEFLATVIQDIHQAERVNVPLRYRYYGLTVTIDPIVSAAQPAEFDKFVAASEQPKLGYTHITKE